eukprot:1143400-Pelagomonas_calceolata.AAC.3
MDKVSVTTHCSGTSSTGRRSDRSTGLACQKGFQGSDETAELLVECSGLLKTVNSDALLWHCKRSQAAPRRC